MIRAAIPEGTYLSASVKFPIPKPSKSPPKNIDEINSGFDIFKAFLPLIKSRISANTINAAKNRKPIERSGGAVLITSAIPK
jgi:hypothetical protein